MIRLKKENKKAKEEEEKKTEDAANGIETVVKVKKTPGELRLQKELIELDVPAYAEISYPEKDNIMVINMKINLK